MSGKATGIIHPVIPVFDEMRETVERKASDYADSDNVFSNFEQSAEMAGVLVEDVFLVLMGVKIARIRRLMYGDKEANFESVEDSLIDLANYAALLVAYMRGAA